MRVATLDMRQIRFFKTAKAASSIAFSPSGAFLAAGQVIPRENAWIALLPLRASVVVFASLCTAARTRLMARMSVTSDGADGVTRATLCSGAATPSSRCGT